VVDGFHIRPVTLDDVFVVAHHRASMFLDMGVLTPDLVDDLTKRTTVYLRDAVPKGEYVGWLAATAANRDRIVAGAGVQIRRVLPFPRQLASDVVEVAHGREAIVLNVYTERAFRRLGLARALMQQVIAWAGSSDVDRLVLHAAPDGQSLYEALGFTPTTEMRYDRHD